MEAMTDAKVFVYGWPSGMVGDVPVFGPPRKPTDVAECNPWETGGKC